MLNFYIALLIVSIFLLLVSIVLLIVLFFPKEKHLNYRKDEGGSKVKLFMETKEGIQPLPDGEYKVEGGSTDPTQKPLYFSLRKKLLDLKREAEENGLTKECESEIQKLTEQLKEIEKSTQQIYDNQAWKRHQ